MNQMKINLTVKQQRYITTRYKMTRSKIRRGMLTNIQPSIIFRERGKKQLTYRKNSFDDFKVMIADPPPKFNSEE